MFILSSQQLSFSKDDYLNYVRYYSSHQTSEPLRRFDGNNGKLFLLAKGAEILAGELSKDDKVIDIWNNFSREVKTLTMT